MGHGWANLTGLNEILIIHVKPCIASRWICLLIASHYRNNLGQPLNHACRSDLRNFLMTSPSQWHGTFANRIDTFRKHHVDLSQKKASVTHTSRNTHTALLEDDCCLHLPFSIDLSKWKCDKSETLWRKENWVIGIYTGMQMIPWKQVALLGFRVEWKSSVNHIK